MTPAYRVLRLTDLIRVRHNSGHVIALVRARTLVKPAAMDPDADRELRVLLHRRVANDVERQTGFGPGIPNRIGLYMPTIRSMSVFSKGLPSNKMDLPHIPRRYQNTLSRRAHLANSRSGISAQRILDRPPAAEHTASRGTNPAGSGRSSPRRTFHCEYGL